jgi:hypothetical protein
MGFQTDREMGKACKLIETVIREHGNDPDKNRVSAAEGGAAWALLFGSAAVMIALNPSSGKQSARIRIVSPVVKIDGEFKLELLKRLLELNGTTLPGVSFGLVNDEIVLVSERSIRGLDRPEIEEIIAMIGYYADKYDDLLSLEFGGIRVCDLD